MNCINPVRIKNNLDRREFPDGLEVPCGKCLNCRIQKKSEWSLRLVHEYTQWDDAVFITLTYDEDHVHYTDMFQTTLDKKDVQLFIKRLRKAMSPKKIKYFICGEYGNKTNRAHYHGIIFGVSLRDDDIKKIKDSWKLCDWKMLSDKKSFGLVEPDSINYVAGYIEKKLSGPELEEKYLLNGQENVFRLTSLGHGRKYAEIYGKHMIENKCINHKGIIKSIPRYYLKVLDTDITEIKEYAIEKEMDLTYDILGYHMTRDDVYRYRNKDEILELESKMRERNIQKSRNIKSKWRLKSRKLDRDGTPS